MSLLFSILLLIYGLILFWKSPGMATTIVLGLVVLVNILIRPIVLPLLFAVVPIIIFSVIKNKSKIVYPLIAVTVALFGYMVIEAASKSKYDDARLTAGTYSDIPLYCANNKYIDLQSVYYSGKWNELSIDIYNEATDPLHIKTNWKGRSALLKQKVIDFLKQDPGTALSGILWRITKYTFHQPTWYGKFVFLFWVITVLLLVVQRKLSFFKANWALNLIAVVLPIYIVGLTALFPYVGSRYNLSPNLYYVVCSFLILALLKTNRLERGV
jgi:hypothetical protein